MPIEPLHNEKELLARIAGGDEAAFRSLYEHYWNRIYSLAVHYLRSPATAQDITQDIFLKVWTRRTELTAVGRFDAWFFILSRNTLLNALRQKLPPMVDAHSPGVALTDGNADPGRQLDARETAALIRRAIDQLPPRQQQVYRMSRDQGMKQADIALQLGITHNTVREHMTKALAGIRRFLTEHLDELGLALLLSILS